MLKRYFLSRQGAQVGPYSVSEVLEKIRGGEHFWNDYIFDEAQEDWILLLEHPLFNDIYARGWGRKPLSKPERFGQPMAPKRRYPRASFDGTLIVHDNKAVFRGQTFQISAGGAGLYISAPSLLEQGQTLLLHFHPSPEVPAFNAVASVVGKGPFPDDEKILSKPRSYSVKFTSISQKVKEQIFSFTNKKKVAA
jgi:hypothetical protein